MMVGTTVLACAMMSMGLIEDVTGLPMAPVSFRQGAGVCFRLRTRYRLVRKNDGLKAPYLRRIRYYHWRLIPFGITSPK